MWKVSVIFLAIIWLTACNANQTNVNQNQAQNQENETAPNDDLEQDANQTEHRVIESDDGSLRIRIGEDWNADEELNHRALIAISNRSEEKYFVVRSVSKASMAGGASLNDFVQTTNETMQIKAEHTEIFNETETIIDHNPAKQMEIKAEIDSVKLHYLMTYAESENWFYQISSWSLESQFERHKEELMSMMNSVEFLSEPKTVPESTSEEGSGETKESVTLMGDDGSSEMTFPYGWMEMDDIHPEGNIQASRIDASGEHFFVSITESKQDFSDDITLEVYYDLLIDMQESLIQNKQYTDPEFLTIDGNEAMQFELTGEVDKVKIGYLFTLIETEHALYQTFFWTKQSELDEHADTYRDIIQTFHIMN